jgi:hypothetical protein
MSCVLPGASQSDLINACFSGIRTLVVDGFFMKYIHVFNPTGHPSDVQNGSRPFCAYFLRL